MVTTFAKNPLGQSSQYPTQYAPELLFPIAREQARSELGVAYPLPFHGEDRWTAYEISWLDINGKPQVRLADFVVRFDTPYIIESKSFKLYLNSLNQMQFAQESNVVACMKKDLSLACGSEVKITLYPITQQWPPSSDLAQCIDHIEISITDYHVNPTLLVADDKIRVSNQLYVSHLLKTNCPVTAQPDWASVFIEYSGSKIAEASLLAYLISFREHQDFHENCIERIFCDLKIHCCPERLTVYGRYTRRGGLDINPLRSDDPHIENHSFFSKPLRVNRQ